MFLRNLMIGVLFCLVGCKIEAMKRRADFDRVDRAFKKVANPKLHDWLKQGEVSELQRHIASMAADVNEEDENGYRLIWNVAHNKKISQQDKENLFDLLINHGAEVDQQAPYTGISLLHSLVAEGNVSLVGKLLGAGAGPNLEDENGKIPLNYLSATDKQMNMARVLVPKTDLTHITESGKSVLHNADLTDETAKYLIMMGAPIPKTLFAYLSYKDKVPFEGLKNDDAARRNIIIPGLVQAAKFDTKRNDYFRGLSSSNLAKAILTRQTTGTTFSRKKL